MHSAENPKESYMLAKSLVSSTIRRGTLIKHYFKNRIVPKKRHKNVSDSIEKNIGGYILRNPNIRGNVNFEQVHSAKNCERGTFRDVQNLSKKISQSRKRGSLIVPKT